jgi:aspartate/methionine/tyrosine aminotransferase
MPAKPERAAKQGIFSHKSTHVQNLILELNDMADRIRRSGRKVMALHRGDPPVYFPTPQYVIDAYIKALKEGRTGYSRAQGTPELVDAVISRYKKYGIPLGEKDVIVTAGVSEALLFINNAFIDRGDRAVLLRPYYSQYMMRLTAEEGDAVMGRMLMEKDWRIDINGLRKALAKAKEGRRPKYIMITNPHNPTGTVTERRELKEIVDVANEYGLVLVSDEIYDEIVYNHHTFTSIGHVAGGVPHILLNGSSKNFDSTGFRIGFMAIPGTDRVSEAMREKFSEYALARLSVNTPAEYAVAEAISNTKEHDKAIKSMVDAIQKRVNLTVDLLEENPYLTVTRPGGAFYVFPKLDMKSLGFKDSREFTTAVLEEECVQLTGGSPFGEPDHFRIVALPPEDVLRDAIDRVNGFCERHAR